MAAFARGVRQCVVVGSRPLFKEAFKSSPDQNFQVFTVDEEQLQVRRPRLSQRSSHPKPSRRALEKSDFDKLKASLFIWLGDPGYRTVDAVIAGLAFIASLPGGSGVVFDYAVERTSLRTGSHRSGRAGQSNMHGRRPEISDSAASRGGDAPRTWLSANGGPRAVRERQSSRQRCSLAAGSRF